MKSRVNLDRIAKTLGVPRGSEEGVDMRKLAKTLGAESAGEVVAGGGYFGAMQLAAEVRARLQKPARGGRSTDPRWTERRLVPLKPETLERLTRIAAALKARNGIDVHPLQVAAILLEHDVESLTDDEADRLIGAGRAAR